MERVIALVCVFVMACGATPAVPAPGQVYEFTDGRWWDGSEFSPRTVWSVDGTLTETRPGRVDAVVDLEGGYVVPPFGEAHTHTLAYVRSRVDEFLSLGVFYAIVMNVDCSVMEENRAWFNRPESVDVLSTCVGVTGPNAHPLQIGLRGDATVEDLDGDWVTILETPADLERKWPELRRQNPDLIKAFLIYSEKYEERRDDPDIPMRYRGMDPDLLRPLIERAHSAGRRVAVHVRTAADFTQAVEAGADIIAHLPGFSMGTFVPEQLQDPERRAEVLHPEWFRITPTLAAETARRGAVVIPTLGLLDYEPQGPDSVRAEVTESLRVRREVVRANLQLLRDAGVRMAVGSDQGEGDPVTEALVMDELGLFEPTELLRMLTENVARLAFPDRLVGRLEPGYEASFVVLGRDPIRDFSAIRDVRYLFKDGQPLVADGS
jgi:hypothetical protein